MEQYERSYIEEGNAQMSKRQELMSRFREHSITGSGLNPEDLERVTEVEFIDRGNFSATIDGHVIRMETPIGEALKEDDITTMSVDGEMVAPEVAREWFQRYIRAVELVANEKNGAYAHAADLTIERDPALRKRAAEEEVV